MILELNKKTDGYWRVAQVNLDYDMEFNSVVNKEELFEKREDAEARLKEYQEEQERMSELRDYIYTDYQLRFVSNKRLEAEKRQKLEKWHEYLRTSYLDPLKPEVFSSCCQKLITSMKEKLDKLSVSDIDRIQNEVGQYFCPWQSYAVKAKIWSYVRFEEDSEKVSYWGVFVQETMFGTLAKRIESFDCLADFRSWLENTNQAAALLEENMLDALKSSIEDDHYPQG